MGRQSIDEHQQSRQRGVQMTVIARFDIDPKHKPKACHLVGVIGVRGASEFLRVVADHRAFLVTVEGFHGDIDIEDPRGREQRRNARIEVSLSPRDTRLRINHFEKAAHRVFGDYAMHAEQLRHHPIEADRVDVGVTTVTGEEREKPRAQDMLL